jgi:subtilisin
MTALITQELEARGVAQVIIIVKEPVPMATAAPSGTAAAANAGPIVRSLVQHYVSSEMSQVSALATAAAAGRPVRALTRAGGATRRDNAPVPPPARYYPNLGVILGTVNREGYAALSQDPHVAAVTGSPPLSLIRPTRVRAARLTRKITWGIQAMRVPALWRQGLSGEGILVGHLDTGVDGQREPRYPRRCPGFDPAIIKARSA